MLEIGPVPEEQATDAVSSYEGTEPWQVVQPSWRRGKPGNASPAIPEEPRANPGQSILERMAPAVLQAEPVASSSRKSGAPLPDPLYAQYNAGTATQERTPASVEWLASAQALLQQRHPKVRVVFLRVLQCQHVAKLRNGNEGEGRTFFALVWHICVVVPTCLSCSP